MTTKEHKFFVEVCDECGQQVARNFRDRWECEDHGDQITATSIKVVPAAKYEELQDALKQLAISLQNNLHGQGIFIVAQRGVVRAHELLRGTKFHFDRRD